MEVWFENENTYLSIRYFKNEIWPNRIKVHIRSLSVRKGCFNIKSWQSRWQNKVSTLYIKISEFRNQWSFSRFEYLLWCWHLIHFWVFEVKTPAHFLVIFIVLIHFSPQNRRKFSLHLCTLRTLLNLNATRKSYVHALLHLKRNKR